MQGGEKAYCIAAMLGKIDNALVLCAGFGTRLKPLTDFLPKPLLDVRGKPMLVRILDKLVQSGISNIVVNTCHLPQKYAEFFDIKDGSAAYRGARIAFLNEPQILDTGGALKNAVDRVFGTDSPVLVHNGDIFFDAPLARFLEQASALPQSAVLCLRSRGANTNVETDGNAVRDMRGILGAHGTKKAQFAGVFLAKQGFLEFIKKYPKNIFSTVDAFLERIPQNEVACVFEDDGAWCDIGTLSEYTAVNRGSGFAEFNALALLAERGFVAKKYGLVKKGASTRAFMKFETAAPRFGLEKFAACFYDPHKREDSLYADIARFLFERKFPVPQVLLHDAPARIIVMADAGNRDLGDIKDPAKRAEIYRAVIRHIARLHTEISADAARMPVELSEAFGENLYKWEQRYFAEECAKNRFGISADCCARDFRTVRETLEARKSVLLHRDLQSQNVMVDDSGNPVFIDFQGMRLGNQFYDLASLLFDPYTDVPDGEALARLYCAQTGLDYQNILREIYTAACERLMQALGAYGFLTLKRKMPFYEKFFLPALENLAHCAINAELRDIAHVANMCLEKLR